MPIQRRGGSSPPERTKILFIASVAQMVEQRIENPCVAGSIPARGTNVGGVEATSPSKTSIWLANVPALPAGREAF